MTMQFLLLLICGAVGGSLFVVLHIPGGAMLGAVVAVLAFKLSGTISIQTPPLFQICVEPKYIPFADFSFLRSAMITL